MDFGKLLHMAKKNSEVQQNEGKFYRTKFAPPKKESKESKKLSNNIQKFLHKRDQEERERQHKEREKVASLLAMRDDKSKNKIKKMLKVTKSANKSVLDDAINSEHTAVTMEGPDQPDQDDYGYVSTEANAFYQKYIEKVKDVKEDKGFAPSRPQSLKDLSGTKERVKAAITRDVEDKKNHTRQRSTTSTPIVVSKDSSKSSSNGLARAYSTSKSLYDPEGERQEEERKKREEEQKRNKNRKAAPPPLDFHALLKLAEKKQHEPVEIVAEVKKKEPERLLTSKEKRELEERLRAREERERRKRDRITSPVKGKDTSIARMEPNGRIPKLNQSAKLTSNASGPSASSNKLRNNVPSTKSPSCNQSSNKVLKKITPNTLSPPTSIPKTSTHFKSKSTSSSNLNSKPISSSLPKTSASTSSIKGSKTTSVLPATSKNPYASTSNKNTNNGPTREFPPRDMKTIKSKPFPPADMKKSRQFPPADVRREVPGRLGDSRKAAPLKRRIIDDDDDEEYDSELDDFIDDGDCEEDISSHIKAIFGYDKSRYRHVDDDDDAAMESNFAQVQREEFLSKKLGMQEDLEDMKIEAMEKKRKMMKKKGKLYD